MSLVHNDTETPKAPMSSLQDIVEEGLRE